MYSPVSHIHVDGDIVTKYNRNIEAAATAAALYDGRGDSVIARLRYRDSYN